VIGPGLRTEKMKSHDLGVSGCKNVKKWNNSTSNASRQGHLGTSPSVSSVRWSSVQVRSSDLGVSKYVSVTTRLRSSSGHGLEWRTGMDCQCSGSFTNITKFLSFSRGRDPGGPGVSVCEQFVLLPTSLHDL
jgi:hypothetical protein